MLEGLHLILITPAQDGADPPVEEAEDSPLAIAEAKAMGWARRYQLACLATDGGLAVPALGDRWRPSLTRRAAGTCATDEQRAAHLLRLMRSLEGEQRRAYLVEAAALALSDGSLVGSWEALSDTWVVAETYDSRGVLSGFWLPGVLEFGSGQRYGDLTPGERDAVDGHWERLRPLVRDAVAGLAEAGRF
jgi:inosine/xanthosine triphosphate pyrophosphatase family protein